MSGAKVLDFSAAHDLANLDFCDLENRLKQRLKATKTFPDLEKLIGIMNPLLKAGRFSAKEQTILKRLRQRAYDRRRNPKFQTLNPVSAVKSTTKIQTDPYLDQIEHQQSPFIKQTFSTKPPAQTGVAMPTAITEKNLAPEVNRHDFSQGALKAIASINAEHVVKTLPKMLILFTSASLVCFFLWHQSLALYESAGFADAIYAAAGGLLMVIGFAAYHALTRSWLALFFCLYAGSYEGYLMVSGTINNELQIQTQALQTNPDLVFLKERAARSLAHYHELKQRYDNPESKVFKNDWFLKTHLNPAWQESTIDHKELMTKEAALAIESKSQHITWLKIFYRLCLVFLCMMLVHRFFASFLKNV